jgi:hypothetical protein
MDESNDVYLVDYPDSGGPSDPFILIGEFILEEAREVARQIQERVDHAMNDSPDERG